MVISTLLVAIVAVVACVAVVMARVLATPSAPQIDRVDVKQILEQLDALRERETASGQLAAGRLERLEYAIDAIALEVERLGEGQRFVTKLLADRPTEEQIAGPPAQRGRVITPH
jgi:hypothetical protein